MNFWAGVSLLNGSVGHEDPVENPIVKDPGPNPDAAEGTAGPIAIRDGIRLSNTALQALITEVHGCGAGFRFRVGGESMRPALRNGDVVTLSPCSSSGVGLGDVIAFRHPATGSLMLHRVIRMHSTGVETMGDNLRQSDGVVPWESLLGLVTRVERHERDLPWATHLDAGVFRKNSGRARALLMVLRSRTSCLVARARGSLLRTRS